MEPRQHITKQYYRKAEEVERRLRKEIEETLTFCKESKLGYTHWVDTFFNPAINALAPLSKEASPIRRLSDACINLQVFGGMGSWSDEGGGNIDSLYAAYKEANNLYQEAWAQGVK